MIHFFLSYKMFIISIIIKRRVLGRSARLYFFFAIGMPLDVSTLAVIRISTNTANNIIIRL